MCSIHDLIWQRLFFQAPICPAKFSSFSLASGIKSRNVCIVVLALLLSDDSTPPEAAPVVFQMSLILSESL